MKRTEVDYVFNMNVRDERESGSGDVRRKDRPGPFLPKTYHSTVLPGGRELLHHWSLIW